MNTRECFSYNNETNTWDAEDNLELTVQRGFAASIELNDDEVWFLGGQTHNDFTNWIRSTEICSPNGPCRYIYHTL